LDRLVGLITVLVYVVKCIFGLFFGVEMGSLALRFADRGTDPSANQL
jgi:hypothetical protein